jgi:aquaporin Z
MQKYVTEFIGTFFLNLVIVLACNNGTGNLAPIAYSCVLVAMIYAGGHLSKAHYNPAVSIAFLILGIIDKKDFPFYLIAQFIASFFGAAVAIFLLHSTKSLEIISRVNDPISTIIAELLGTFALVWTILNVTTTKANSGNSHYGIAIGFAVLGLAYALGPISGSTFNPAVAVGLCTAGMSSFGDLWLYFVGNILGAAAAATVFSLVYGREEYI